MKQPIQTSPPPFPIDALPEKTRQIVGEIQYQTQASASTIASAVLCAMATAAQFKVVIEHANRDRHLSWPSLFMVNIDDCGAVKSEAFRLAFKGLHYYQKFLDSNNEKRCEKIKNLLSSHQKTRGDIEPETPKYHEITKIIEGLENNLAILKRAVDPSRGFIQSHAGRLSLRRIATQSSWRAAVINPEADSALGVSSLRKLDNFSRGWNCQDERALTGLESMVIKSNTMMDFGLYRNSPHISVCVAMRSAALQEYLTKKQSSAHIGSFIERCLFAWADDSNGNGNGNGNDRLVAPSSTPTALNSFQNQTSMLANLISQKTIRLEHGIGGIKESLLHHYWSSTGCDSDFAGLSAYISYQYENTLRVAAILELIEDGRSNGESLRIRPDTIQRTKTLIEWHIQTYLFIFFTGVKKQTLEDAIDLRNKLQSLIKRMLQEGIVPQYDSQRWVWLIGKNELYQRRPDRAVGTDRFNQALTLLSRQGLLREDPPTSKKIWLWVYTDQLGNLAQVSG